MLSPGTSYAHLTPRSFLERSAHVFRDKDAVVYRQKRWTYAEFAVRVYRFANALRQWGLQKGDRVAFLCPNIPPLLEAHFGVPLAGGILVAINTRLAPADIAYILNDAGARLVFIDTEFTPLLAPIRDDLKTVAGIVNIIDEQAPHRGETLPGLEYESFLGEAESTPPASNLTDENDPISINYTSGTSGKPKGVIYSHRGAYLNALGEVRWYPKTGQGSKL